ncbi:MAG TPA: hypothetical protein DCP92_11445 [Nitrospiraceae bacterium]|nr:hypothetical protein [Nitrospiraceae bacterium]
MCLAYETNCCCGKDVAGFHFKDEIMSREVIRKVYCQDCSRDVPFNPKAMIADNGWIIEYEIDVALFQAQRIRPGTVEITPDFIFDEDYCTWRGIYPTDHIDRLAEREAIVKLAKINPRKYLAEIKEWAKSRMERLSQEGWRKAQRSETHPQLGRDLK